MISRAYITAWRSTVPWSTDAQVEQDLVLSRAVVDLFSDPLICRELALRGGTALHKLYLSPAGRYSEDIDLVQVAAGPIGGAMDAVRARLDPWLEKPHWKQGEGRVTIAHRFQSEAQPTTPLRFKVEINTREHFCVLGTRRIQLDVSNPWYTGSADVLTYEPEELLGTKLRALYQRKRGRDLFDLAVALDRIDGLDSAKIVACFTRYIEEEGRRITRTEFVENLARKIGDEVFLRDLPPLLALGLTFDPASAAHRVRSELLSRLPEGASGKRRPRT